MKEKRDQNGFDGVLLMNLGTPSALTLSAVRAYLKEFLMDPKVIDIPTPLRWLLVHTVILLFRAPKTLEAYRAIWNQADGGSPLAVFSRQLLAQVRSKLPPRIQVEWAMRYQQPSIEQALVKLQKGGKQNLLIFPLYPQYAESTTLSSELEVKRWVKKLGFKAKLTFHPPFYNHPAYLKALGQTLDPFIEEIKSKPKAHAVLFSYHSIPERHVLKADPSGNHCRLDKECCQKEPSWCYRAHCLAVSRRCAEQLALDHHWTSFQSKLGRQPWLTPDTESVLVEMASQGIKKVWVVCPSFVADCLETLEEIAIRAKEVFLEAGGEQLTLIPSLNAQESWSSAVVEMIETLSPLEASR